MNLTTEIWIQAVANGLAIGWLYILMALGMTLILSIMGILQLAHGEIYMIGAYIVFFLCDSLHINVYLAMVISMIVMAGCGIFIERFLFRPVRSQILGPIVISLGITLVLTSIAAVGFGLYQKSLPRLAQGIFYIFESAIPLDRIVAVGFAILLMILLYLFLKRTMYGRAMVASAQSHEGALLRGVDSNLMSSLAMAIGCALAAAAGTMAGSILNLGPYMGTLPMVKGLVIIVLGGMGSLIGSVVGGLMLGLIDGVVPVVFNAEVATLSPLIIVIIILLFRPQGLFGHE